MRLLAFVHINRHACTKPWVKVFFILSWTLQGMQGLVTVTVQGATKITNCCMCYIKNSEQFLVHSHTSKITLMVYRRRAGLHHNDP